MASSKGRRRRSGSIRGLPSGRYQVRYSGPDGVVRPADETFETKADAEDWLTLKVAEILEDDWIDPDADAVLVADYGVTWIDGRPKLRPKTIRIYRGLLYLRIAPYFANVTVAEVTLARVRRWRKKLLDSGVSEVTAAKPYRLLRAIFNTALDDCLIRHNPRRIKGAGEEDSAERPVLTLAQANALADVAGLRYRALILLAAFTSLRWAELALSRKCSGTRLCMSPDLAPRADHPISRDAAFLYISSQKLTNIVIFLQVEHCEGWSRWLSESLAQVARVPSRGGNADPEGTP